MRIQRVLCPTDLLNGSHIVLHHATVIAQRYGAELRVLRTAGVDDETTAIVECARDERIDLIVMGTHGHSSVERRRRGSLAARVRACVAVPVLSVPVLHMPVLSVSAASTPVVDAPPPSMATPAARDARAIVPFGRVLCAANLSEGTQAAVALAQWFAQGHDAELTLLHIVERLSPEDVLDIGRLRLDVVIQERQEQAAARLRALLPHYARMSGQARERVEFGSPAETILDVAREWHADLIVLGVEERSRLSSLLLGSTTRAVVARAAAPVLTATPATAMSWRPVHHYLEAGGVH